MADLVSVNQFKTWTKCKKKYYYDYVQKLRWPTDQSHFQFGKTIHKLFEYQARGLDFADLLTQASPEIQGAWAALQEHPIPHLPVVASEWAFHVPIAFKNKKVWLAGRVDRISLEDDTLLILDWKTGTSAPSLPEVDWQTTLYLYAVLEAQKELHLEKCHFKKDQETQEFQHLEPRAFSPESLRFVYVEVKKQDVKAISILYNAEKHQATQERLIRTLAQMNQEKGYQLPNQCPDPYCPYRSICGIQDVDPAPKE
jgi:hypothetical protein